ncbi:glycosyltransferase [Luteimonas sp. 8-5]|uniref:glycosyltransferase n=1 Tax=Luteimonas sp. 8-5 TaxID=3039387 RepID=UPI00243717A0|nr:glycosyltransferase [Luteimonas sp. 8-5]MDG6348869.1 glycosyltransferase [Luteimonas sp. 8-5]
MKRRLLFHRDFLYYTGGHGKVWNYFQHARAHPAWSPRVFLSPASIAAGNPWLAHPESIDARWDPGTADALLLGGTDWSMYPVDDPGRPVINLVQHVRHADAGSQLRSHLRRRAIRICVSRQVADAILATGETNGPVRVIEAALDLPSREATPTDGRRGIFIDAMKQPDTGAALHRLLRERGRDSVLSTTRMPRGEYLDRLGSAAVAVLLPHPREGFFLPALEAMALGCATIVPDSIGNRAYLEPGRNALVPQPDPEALLEAVLQLDDDALAARLVQSGRTTARRFDLAGERRAFHAILDDLDALWRA